MSFLLHVISRTKLIANTRMYFMDALSFSSRARKELI